MTFDPLPADTIVFDATIITMSAANDVIDGGAIAITNGRIAAVGTTAEVRSRFATQHLIDAGGGIVLPGFVNLHTHLAMTLFRGWADDRDLQEFLDRLFPSEARVVSPTTVRVGADLAFAESVRAGITTSLDMYFYPKATAEAARQVGVRVANGPVVFAFSGPDNMAFAARMADADRLLGSSRHELTSGRWLCPHGTYTNEIAHLEEVRDLAAHHDARLTIHVAENAAEVATVVAATGRRPVELLHDLGMLSPRMVLAHAVELTDQEISMIAATGAAVAHNPLSNMKLASGFARVPELLAAGVTIGLGTDGPSSSNDLDLYVALRFAATMHKGNMLDASVLPARQVLRMATIDGARALGLDAEIRSIEVGKRADLQLLWADHPNLVPSYDPISTVVFAAGRGDVRTVLVEGATVLRDGVLTTIDLAKTLADARQIAHEVRATA